MIMVSPILVAILSVVMITDWAVGFDIPNWTQAGAKCGIWQKEKYKSNGRRHYIIFPNVWRVKSGTVPKAFLSVETDSKPLPTWFNIQSGAKKFPKVLRNNKPATKKFSVRAVSFDMANYQENYGYMLKSVYDVRVHVQIRWTDTSNNEMSYSYWSLPRSLLWKEYYCVTSTADGDASVPTIVILNPEFGVTIASVKLPDDTDLVVTYNSVSYGPGDTISDIQIKRYYYETITASSGDLTGARVTGDNVLAVWCGNGAVSSNSETSERATDETLSDASLEMLVPTRSWSNYYITAIPSTSVLGSSDGTVSLVITAKSDSTEVTIDDESITLSTAGSTSTKDYDISSSSATLITVSADKPVQVIQILTKGDKSITQQSILSVPSTSNFDTEYQFNLAKQSGWSYTAYIVFNIDDQFSLLVNGASMSEVTWITSDYTSTYSLASFSLEAGKDYFLTSSEGSSFGAWYIAVSDNNLQASALGHYLQYRQCFPCKGTQCDWRDDDCDGVKNEEVCNKIDDDGDGLVDEDCCLLVGKPVSTWTITKKLQIGLGGGIVGVAILLGAVIAAVYHT